MSAIRVARAATGRDDIVKIEGSYHGHHDTVMFSVVPELRPHGRARAAVVDADVARHPGRRRRATRTSCRSTTSTCFEQLLDERGDEIACLILEPVMMNIGIAEPAARLPRRACKDLLHQHGALLIFDEVKSGATVAARRRGRALRRAARPRVLRQGDRAAARPARRSAAGADVMDVDRAAAPRSRARSTATRSSPRPGSPTLTEVLTPDAYAHLAELGTRLADGCATAIDRERHPRPHRRPRRQGLRVVPARAAAELPRLPRDQHRALRRRRTRGWSTAACS